MIVGTNAAAPEGTPPRRISEKNHHLPANRNPKGPARGGHAQAKVRSHEKKNTPGFRSSLNGIIPPMGTLHEFYTVTLRNTRTHTVSTTIPSTARRPIWKRGITPASTDRIASMAKLSGLTWAIAESHGGITL